MILEGIDPPIIQPGVTWYVRKHYTKEVADGDTNDELTLANKAIDEEIAFLQNIDNEEAEHTMAAKTANSESIWHAPVEQSDSETNNI